MAAEQTAQKQIRYFPASGAGNARLSEMTNWRKSHQPSAGNIPGPVHQQGVVSPTQPAPYRSMGPGRSSAPYAPAENPQRAFPMAHASGQQFPAMSSALPLPGFDREDAYPLPLSHVATPAQAGCKPPAPYKPPRGGRDGRDPITPPSAASGGVPEPTPEYLLRASFLPQELPAPRPILVVIDLNGTLLYRPAPKKDPSRFVARPHALAFLSYCIDTFHVVIWSSARERNVAAMCATLLTREQQALVLAVWSRERFGLSPDDYNRHVQCYKRLTRLWADPAVAAAHPLGAAWDQGNTVLIDDSAEKARSEPYNAIQIPEFCGDPAEDQTTLPQVHDYLNTLACQHDISMYIRAHPFKGVGGLGRPA